MRKTILAGNWKMHKTLPQSIEFASKLVERMEPRPGIEIVICPTNIALADVCRTLTGSDIDVGAQNMHQSAGGAYTGEVSAEMLIGCGCKYVIIGHSERRQYFGETDESVNQKLKTALAIGLIPIVCVGESLAQREADQYQAVIGHQIAAALNSLNNAQIGKLVIAYEPIWAIGTGKTASPEQAQEVHELIRQLVAKASNKQIADSVSILYGGSVKPSNIAAISSQPDIDGGLVGGAALEVDSFAALLADYRL